MDNKRRPGPRRRCYCCNGTPISKEYLLAGWMRPYLRESFEGMPHFISLHRRSQASFEPYGTSRRFYAGDYRSRKVKSVCKTCNETWMSRLQKEVKPALLPLSLGERAELRFSPEELTIRSRRGHQ